MKKCSAIKVDGTHCKGSAIDSSGFCHAHHPDRAEQRRRNASKGGKRGGRGRPVAELANLRDENANIRERLLGGELEPKVASVAIQSVNCDARLLDVLLKAREQEELEGRLQELEEALERQKGRPGFGA